MALLLGEPHRVDLSSCAGVFMYASVFACKQQSVMAGSAVRGQIKMSSPPAHFHSHLSADLWELGELTRRISLVRHGPVCPALTQWAETQPTHPPTHISQIRTQTAALQLGPGLSKCIYVFNTRCCRIMSFPLT